ncbi:unnamed protein product [Lampetra fluviatilis]
MGDMGLVMLLLMITLLQDSFGGVERQASAWSPIAAAAAAAPSLALSTTHTEPPGLTSFSAPSNSPAVECDAEADRQHANRATREIVIVGLVIIRTCDQHR